MCPLRNREHDSMGSCNFYSFHQRIVHCHITARPYLRGDKGAVMKEKGAVMTILFPTAALGALATPALSQTADRTEQLAQYQPRAYDSRTYDYNAYARERDVRVIPRSGHSLNPRNDVYGPRGE